MAKLRTGQKVSRVVRFLLGLRDHNIAAQLTQHGFNQEELDRGWSTLRNAVGQKLETGGARTVDPRVIEALDSWENLWFPVVSAALAHRYPDTHTTFFRNLGQTTGPEVVLSVGTFVRRYAELAEGADGQAARRLLAERGISEAIIDEAKAMLEEVRTVEETDAPDMVTILEEQRAAEDAMWKWYLEWSTIARTVIKDHFLLRRLGFRKTKRAADASAASDEPRDAGGEVDADGDDGDVDDGGEGDVDVEAPVIAPIESAVSAPA